MAQNFNIELKGFREINTQLQSLPTKIAAKILAKGTLEGAKVVKKAAQSNVPKKAGKLRQSIKTRRIQTNSKLEIKYEVGLPPKTKGFYGRFLEWGTKGHTITIHKKKILKFNDMYRKKVNHPGQRAKPWLKPAFLLTQPNVINKMREVLSSELSKIK